MHLSGADAFPFDGQKITVNFGDQPPIPAFVRETLSEDDEYRVTRDEFGFVIQQKKGRAYHPDITFISKVRLIRGRTGKR